MPTALRSRAAVIGPTLRGVTAEPDGTVRIRDAVLACGLPMTRIPPGGTRPIDEVLVIDRDAIDLSRAEAGGGVPMLYMGHRADLPIGCWQHIRIAGGRLIGDGHLTRLAGTVSAPADPGEPPPPPQPIGALIASVLAGHCRGIEPVYRVDEGVRISRGESYGPVRGAERETLIATRWTLIAASLTPISPDGVSGLRTLRAAAPATHAASRAERERIAAAERMYAAAAISRAEADRERAARLALMLAVGG